LSLSQDQIFAASEGDRWFQRNQTVLESIDLSKDGPLRLIDLYGLVPKKVLEIGAANGWRVAAIATRFGCEVVAQDPSQAAIAHGKSAYPEVEFVGGSASEIPLKDVFDLIIVNGVLCWIDRSTLFRTLAEIDRLLADDGHLIIGDFCPSNRMRVRYHHLPDAEVYTYKQDYSAIFLASGLYHQVALLTFDHSSRALRSGVTENDRFSASLLRKAPRDLYAESVLSPLATAR
jgi:SAM-dependent methyltransferase